MATQTVSPPPKQTQTPQQGQSPAAPVAAPPPAPVAASTGSASRVGYAVTVRRARSVLQFLLVATLIAGITSTLVGFFAVNRALQSYREIVADSAESADESQAARLAILDHHRAAAETLSFGEINRQAQVENAWQRYQFHLRRVWQNRSDVEFGEFAVFNAADNATWQYRARIDAMLAFLRVGDRERAQSEFLDAHTMLVREVLPALNGLANVKLESMEEAYASTNEDVNQWRILLLVTGGAAVLLLAAGFLLTRFWLRYAITWELLLATVVAIALFFWFNYSLSYAATEVETLVGSAYESIAGVQAVQSYVTQAEALESMAIFAPEQAEVFLSDAQEYLFLAEQRLCGELACTDTDFSGDPINEDVIAVAKNGQAKYGFPDTPLVVNALEKSFQGEAGALTALGTAIQRYRAANAQLATDLGNGATASEGQRIASDAAYQEMSDAADREQNAVRTAFDSIYDTVVTLMDISFWLTLLFTLIALLGAYGLRRRRLSLFP